MPTHTRFVLDKIIAIAHCMIKAQSNCGRRTLSNKKTLLTNTQSYSNPMKTSSSTITV